MYDDILLPIDDADSADEAVAHVREIATTRDARVHVLSVVDDRSFLTLDDAMQTDVLGELRADAEVAVDAVATDLADAGVDVTTAVRRGDPAEAILAYADEATVDLVAMGTRGADYTENMLGSTAQTVVSRADRPVLTVAIGE